MKEKYTKTMTWQSGRIVSSPTCCGMGEIGALVPSMPSTAAHHHTFPKGETHKVINYLVSLKEHSCYHFTTHSAYADAMVENLKDAGVEILANSEWISNTTESRLRTVFFKIPKNYQQNALDALEESVREVVMNAKTA